MAKKTTTSTKKTTTSTKKSTTSSKKSTSTSTKKSGSSTASTSSVALIDKLLGADRNTNSKANTTSKVSVTNLQNTLQKAATTNTNAPLASNTTSNLTADITPTVKKTSTSNLPTMEESIGLAQGSIDTSNLVLRNPKADIPITTSHPEKSFMFDIQNTFNSRNKKSSANSLLTDPNKAIQDTKAKIYSNADIRDTYDAELNGGSNVNFNTKYNVNLITTSELSKMLSSSTMQLWCVEDGNSIGKIFTGLTDDSDVSSTYNAGKSIGRDRLYGLDKNLKFVFYDSATNKFYSYAYDSKLNEKRNAVTTLDNAISDLNAKFYNENGADLSAKYTYEAMLKKYAKVLEDGNMDAASFEQYQLLYKKLQNVTERLKPKSEEYNTEYSKLLYYKDLLEESNNSKSMSLSDITQYRYLKNKDQISKANKLIESKVSANELFNLKEGDALYINPLKTKAKNNSLVNTLYGLKEGDDLYLPTGLTSDEQTEYDRLSRLYNKYKNYPVYADDDYINKLNADVEKQFKQRDAYAKAYESTYLDHPLSFLYASMDDTTRANSLGDVVRRAVGRTVWDQFQDTTVLSDLVNVAYYKIAPITSMFTGDVTIKQGAAALVQNVLTDMMETMDLTNIFAYKFAGAFMYSKGNYDDPVYSAWLRSEAQKQLNNNEYLKQYYLNQYGNQYTSEDYIINNIALPDIESSVAFKDMWGGYGRTMSSTQLDPITSLPEEKRNAGYMILDMLLQIAIDPTTYIDIGNEITKAERIVEIMETSGDDIAKVTAHNIATYYSHYMKLTDEDIAKINEYAYKHTKQAVKRFIRDGADSDEMVAYIARTYTDSAEKLGRYFGTRTIELTKDGFKNTSKLFKNSDAGYKHILQLQQGAVDELRLKAITATSPKLMDEFSKAAVDIAHSYNTVSDITNKLQQMVLKTTAYPLVPIFFGAKKVLRSISETEAVTKLARWSAEALVHANKAMGDVVTKGIIFAKGEDALAEVSRRFDDIYRAAAKDLTTEELGQLDKFLQDAGRTLIESASSKKVSEINKILNKQDTTVNGIMEELTTYARKNGFNDFNECIDYMIKQSNYFDKYTIVPKFQLIEVQRKYVNEFLMEYRKDTVGKVITHCTNAKGAITEAVDRIIDGITIGTNINGTINTINNTVASLKKDMSKFYAESGIYDNSEIFEEVSTTLLKCATDVGNGTLADIDLLRQVVDDFNTQLDHYIKVLEDNRAQSVYKSCHITKTSAFKTPLRYKTSNAAKYNATSELHRAMFDEVARRISSIDYTKKQDLHELINNAVDNVIKDNAEKLIEEFDGDISELGRLYTVMFDKTAETLLYTNNEALRAMANTLFDNNSKEYMMLRDLKADFVHQTKDVNCMGAASIEDLFNACSSIRSTYTFIDTITKQLKEIEDVDGTIMNAIYDSFCGNASGAINSFAAKFIATGDHRYINYAVDVIINDTLDYLRQTSNKSLYETFKYGCNKVNTESNLNRMLEVIQEMKGNSEYSQAFNDAFKVGEDSEYTDVYFSIASETASSDPSVISFMINGETYTFYNSHNPIRSMHKTNIKKLYGAGYTEDEVIKEFRQLTANATPLTNSQFRIEVNGFIQDSIKTANTNEKPLRFIGFNNSRSMTNQTGILQELIDANGVPVHTDNFVDIGEIIRKCEGFATVDDNTRTAVFNALTNAFYAARTDAAVIGKSYVDVVLDSTKSIRTITENISLDEVDSETKEVLSVLFKDLQDNYDNIQSTVYDLGGTLLGKAFTDKDMSKILEAATGKAGLNINATRMFKNVFDADLTGEEFLAGRLNVKKRLDTEIAAEWFGHANLSELVRNATTIEDIDRIHVLTSKLNSYYDGIVNSWILERVVGARHYEDLFNTMLASVAVNVDVTERVAYETLNLFDNLTLSSAKDYYSACRVLYDSFGGMFENAETSATFKLLTHDDNNILKALETVKSSDLKQMIYTRDRKALNYIDYTGIRKEIISSAYLDYDEGKILRAALEAYTEANKSKKDLGMFLDALDSMYRTAGKLTPADRVQFRNFNYVSEPFIDFVDAINKNLDNPMLHSETFEGLKDNIEANKRMSKCIKQLDDLKYAHADIVYTSVLSLSDEDLEKYVVRNCINHLVIDPSSRVFKDNEKLSALLAKRLEEIESNPNSGLRVVHTTIESKGKDVVCLYKVVDNADKLFREFNDTTTDFVKNYRSILKSRIDDIQSLLKGGPDARFEYDFKNPFYRYMDRMSEYMPDNYMGSTFDVITQDSFKTFDDLFPEEAKISTGRFNSWFDESYSCSIWGDYDLQSYFNPYSSSNMINSMTVGLHQVRNKMQATDNIATIFTDPTQKFSYILKKAGVENTVDWKKLQHQITDRGYTLASIRQDDKGIFHIASLNMTSYSTYKAYLESDNVILIDNEMYGVLNQKVLGQNTLTRYANSNPDLSQMGRMWVRTVRNATITGMLFLSNLGGTGLRNIVDSALKGFNDRGFAYAKDSINALEYKRAYEDMCSDVFRRYGKCDTTDIVRYYNEVSNPTLPKELVFDELIPFYNSTSAGIIEMNSIKKNYTNKKLRGIITNRWGQEISDKITDDMLDAASKQYNKAMGKFKTENGLKLIDAPSSEREKYLSAVQEDAMARIKKTLHYDDDVNEVLGELFYNHVYPSFSGGDTLMDIPIIGGNKQVIKFGNVEVPLGMGAFNSKIFSSAETMARTGVALGYMREYGDTFARANMAVKATQFDYAVRPGWLSKLEVLFPFSTFKLYNTQYWFTEGTKKFTSLKNILRYTEFTNPSLTTEELASLYRSIAYKKYYANNGLDKDLDALSEKEDNEDDPGFKERLKQFVGRLYPDDAVENSALEYYNGTIDSYLGVSRNNVNGFWLNNRHYLKLGNSFVDSLDMLASIYTFIPQLMNHEIPSLLSDNMFGPFSDALGFIEDRINNYKADAEDKEDMIQYIGENSYTWMNLVPGIGQFLNSIYTNLKAANANGLFLQELSMVGINSWLKQEYGNSIADGVLDTLGIMLPSLIGTAYDSDNYFDRPVGYNWYDQDDAYKQTHKFVWGISSVPYVMAAGKDPTTYIDWTGKFMRMGYTQEEAAKIVSMMFGDDKLVTNNDWYSYESDGTRYLKIDRISEALEILAGRGWSLAEAIKLLQSSDKWVNPTNGKVLNNAEFMGSVAQSTFFNLYQQLPDYIKYGDGQYAGLKSYWMSQGYSTEEAWIKMYKNPGYIGEDGKWHALTAKQVEAYNTQVNEEYYAFTDSLPAWYKYEAGAVSRAMSKLKNEKGLSTEGARAYILKYNYYVDIDGKEHYISSAESAARTLKNSQEFSTYYNSLPNYIKYESGAFSRTLSYLKSTGLSTDEAKALIKKGAYLTVDGRLIDCSKLSSSRSGYSKRNTYYSSKSYYKYTYTKKTYAPKRPKGGYKGRGKYVVSQSMHHNLVPYEYTTKGSNSSTYSKVNALKGSSFGYRQIYRLNTGSSPVRQSLSTKSSYPASYRNIVYAYRHNLYKDLYAKYGTSRMVMRTSRYTNASITRLRRNEIYTRAANAKKRSNF